MTDEQIKQVKRQKLHFHDLPEDVVNFDGEDEYDRHYKNIKVVVDGVVR